MSGHPWATVAARAMDNTSGHVADGGGHRFYSSRLGLLVARQEVAEKEARLAEARMLHYQWEAIDLQREIDKERGVDE